MSKESEFEMSKMTVDVTLYVALSPDPGIISITWIESHDPPSFGLLESTVFFNKTTPANPIFPEASTSSSSESQK
ncbi:hypothetical protein OGAPHI_003938 [Ogataea philodendri]|uniref:Uncharacterized protein n=1 Tax=Ogataea philodendri TaxID=1378263 RepID=A0A9P8T558_9ASCO|nr:uncharacterized protein OGAPHI_003938 [Ogataea philodendri]KAH3665750.1 hypothetical protein OGAPHI_003938 [Ogataea philodendri]